MREDITNAWAKAQDLFHEYRALDSQDEAIEDALKDPESLIPEVTQLQSYLVKLEQLRKAIDTLTERAKVAVRESLPNSGRSPEVVLALYKREVNAIEDFRIPGVFDSLCEVLKGWKMPTPTEVKRGAAAKPRAPRAEGEGTGNLRLNVSKVTAYKAGVVDSEYRTLSEASVDLGFDNQAVARAAIEAQGVGGRAIVKKTAFNFNDTVITVFPKEGS
jgi:hypothetical protein